VKQPRLSQGYRAVDGRSHCEEHQVPRGYRPQEKSAVSTAKRAVT
jgi:hypothetical protein